MSEPNVDWYLDRIKMMLGEIDKLTFEETVTNSKRKIISYNTNEIEINIHTIIRKLSEQIETLKQEKGTISVVLEQPQKSNTISTETSQEITEE